MVFAPLMSRACALSPRRDREWCARPTEGECGRAKKNKQAVLERRAGKTGTVYLHITRSHSGAEISRPVGSCYRWETADNIHRHRQKG